MSVEGGGPKQELNFLNLKEMIYNSMIIFSLSFFFFPFFKRIIILCSRINFYILHKSDQDRIIFLNRKG